MYKVKQVNLFITNSVFISLDSKVYAIPMIDHLQTPGNVPFCLERPI